MFFIIAFSPLCLSSNASKYEHIAPYSDFRFSADILYNADFYFIVATPENSSFRFRLFAIVDKKNYGVLKIQTDVLPSKTSLLSSDYIIYSSSFVLPSSDIVIFDEIKSFGSGSSSVVGLVFDYYNDEKYPVYNGSSTYAILASNVDIYNYNGLLLQSANYNTFMKYFDYNLDASRIKNYGSGSSSGGTTFPDNPDDSSDQTEISNNILTNIKNIFSVIVDLPQKIAEEIGNFLTDLKNAFVSSIENLKNNIISGLEYLFKPSDNNFTEIQEIFEDKFKFATQIIGFFKDFTDVRLLDKPPDTNITIYGQTISFINWDFYDRYKGFIDTIIISCSYYFYIRRLIKRLPGIIGGFHT